MRGLLEAESHLLTCDGVMPAFAASSVWEMPRFSMARRRCKWNMPGYCAFNSR